MLPDEIINLAISDLGAKGCFSGPFGSSVSNVPTPSYLMEEQHRHLAATVYLHEPLSSYEERMRADSSAFRVEWPADLILLHHGRIKTRNGHHLAQAWQGVPKSTFAQLFEAVRDRTLKLGLEIRASIGNRDEILDSVSPQNATMFEHTGRTAHLNGATEAVFRPTLDPA